MTFQGQSPCCALAAPPVGAVRAPDAPTEADISIPGAGAVSLAEMPPRASRRDDVARDGMGAATAARCSPAALASRGGWLEARRCPRTLVQTRCADLRTAGRGRGPAEEWGGLAAPLAPREAGAPQRAGTPAPPRGPAACYDEVCRARNLIVQPSDLVSFVATAFPPAVAARASFSHRALTWSGLCALSSTAPW